jgi:DNA-binding MarR family transcriptional regulator
MPPLSGEWQVPVNNDGRHNGRVSFDDACSTFHVRHAWLSLRGLVADELAGHDLSVAQFASLLMFQKSPGLTVADLARAVSTARQSANEMLAGLEQAGLVERRPHPTDRRSHQVFLTEAGRAALAEALPAVRALEARLSAGFTADELAVVDAWLTRMIQAASRPGAAEEIPTI